MAESDWVLRTGSESQLEISRGIISTIEPPAGGFAPVFGSRDNLGNNDAYAYTFTGNSSPVASISAAMQRGADGNATGFSQFLYLLATTSDMTATAYLLGLEDSDPARIVLRKNTLQDGIQDSSSNPFLRRSTVAYPRGTWVHVRLDAIEIDGNVIINCFQDLSGDISSPEWRAPEGLEQLIDDAAGVNTGSVPLVGTTGEAGWCFEAGFFSKNGQAFIDNINIEQQN